jgi:hypothetical protein
MSTPPAHPTAKSLLPSARFVGGILCILLALYSWLLMQHTFSYDSTQHELRIAGKVWSDFGAHIPLIRSFSRGINLYRLTHGIPVESPLFPGEPIRYHFGFYAFAGFLEYIGLPIDWALNIPSAAGFFLLVWGIYRVSFSLFQRVAVSTLSVLFFLCNGSLSFLSFFRAHPIGMHSVIDIVENSKYPVFGPWDNGTITAFWNLNIYTNQRHLAASYAVILIMLWLIISQPKKYTGILLAVSLSILSFINFAALAIAGIFLGWILLISLGKRMPILTAGLLSLPALLFMRHEALMTSAIAYAPYYLVHEPVTALSWLSFWGQNLGLHALLIPLGIVLAPKNIRRLLAPPLLLLFVLPNIFRFSSDMINNHKFFNFFMIVGAMFSAVAVTTIVSLIRNRSKTLTVIARVGVAALLIGALTISGIIDLFPVINDTKGTVSDLPDDDVSYFMTLPKDAVIANSTWFYHPASLAGRAIFSGYTYFTWSYGYAQTPRERTNIAIFEAPDKTALCDTVRDTPVTHIELSDKPESYLSPNLTLWNSLPADYTNPKTGRRVYSADTICAL